MSKTLDENMTLYHRYIYKYWDIILLVLIIALAAFLRSGLLSVPLERDEGEYAYTAQLILQGIPPYAETYSMKMPGIYAVYAFFLMLFGQTHTGIHLGLLLVNILTIALLFLLARQAFDSLAAVVTCATFAILSLNDSLQGIFAHAEHFVIFAAVAGTLLLHRAITLERPRLLLWSGCLFGLGFLIKQHGLAFVAFACLYLLLSELKSRPLLWRQSFFRWFLFLLGVVLPFALTCLLLLILGVFDKFWFWTFVYARQYVSAVPFPAGVELLKSNLMPILASSPFIFLLAGAGLILLFFHWNSYLDKTFVLLFSLFSWLAVCPGLYFRPHYFVLTLPSVALLVGICLSSLDKLTTKKSTYGLRKIVPLFLLSFSLLHSGWHQRDYLFCFLFHCSTLGGTKEIIFLDLRLQWWLDISMALTPFLNRWKLQDT
jgi:4-amino-4-deoxy-L-arabinose transferase-like glycosyltransferase